MKDFDLLLYFLSQYSLFLERNSIFLKKGKVKVMIINYLTSTDIQTIKQYFDNNNKVKIY